MQYRELSVLITRATPRILSRFWPGLWLLLFGLLPVVQLRAESQDFDFGWRFSKGERPEAAQPGFDDSRWRRLDLPHDWAIEGPFDPLLPADSGKLPWKGVALYRKTLDLPAAATGRSVFLDFDGVMASSTIYVNGQKAGGWDNGYNSFRVDLTRFVKFGATNSIVVQVDTRKWWTRWYPGAGIYRKVTLVTQAPMHVAHWGVWVTTPKVTAESADVLVRTTLENRAATMQAFAVKTRLLDPAGKAVAEATTSATLAPGADQELAQPLTVASPVRWDLENPALYRTETTVLIDRKAVGEQLTTFGIRAFRYDAAKGLFLNDKPVKIYGVCLHHDQGALGAALLPRALERQLEIMKEMGCNGIRTSHNPAAPELYEFADRMGFLILDEVFDKWSHKSTEFPEYAERQIRNFVLRDRNHPSVFMWDSGNELGGLDTPELVAVSKQITGYFHKYDPTRPVTNGLNDHRALASGMQNTLDVGGWNYGASYRGGHDHDPAKPQIATETVSTVSTRGYYEFPLVTRGPWNADTLQVTSYDLAAPGWGALPDTEFADQADTPYVMGEFVWTGFDYLGEPTPFGDYTMGLKISKELRSKSSYFGIVDLAGFPKDRFYLYRSHWAPTKTTIHILPHWTWPDRVGQVTPVFVYTNGDSAELFLNGKSLGKRAKVTDKRGLENLALGRPAQASSEETGRGNLSANANDSVPHTRWTASNGDVPQIWQVDLGAPKRVKQIAIDFEQAAKNYQYVVEGSTDGTTWTTLATPIVTDQNTQANHAVNTTSRYLRVRFTGLEKGAWASIVNFAAYATSKPQGSDRYRLRWDDVIYQPGELKAVAYKDGQKIGEDSVHTAGAPARLVATADHAAIHADGYDLSYVTIDLVDVHGTLIPTADQLLKFRVSGPAVIAGVDNGDAHSMEPFQSDRRQLFNGKALVILRSKRGEEGEVTLTISSDGIPDAQVKMQTRLK